ncbi:putative major facilitator superfamily transporter [Gordonia effusa NBRC 100432]|uniref:Putative major facilitator superfamily transporter n=1 Tax=Gordonia effusa NBRC 100432 TaxID=1077974 RepID=H0QUM5_9ACTN|nr:MFS transporter [Gordonia effusa]GAB16526.1 putative major facilitator superfamily transporter [Gordonia effusa NBRC 100432]
MTVASSYTEVLLARVVIGVTIGGFWALAIGVAGELVHRRHLGRAITLVNAGVITAMVIAIPAGTFITETSTWRVAFALAAALTGLALTLQVLALPALPPHTAVRPRQLLAVVRRGRVVAGLAAIALIAAGHFAAFTYIKSAAQETGGFDAPLTHAASPDLRSRCRSR